MQHSAHHVHCHPPAGKRDKVLTGSLIVIALSCLTYVIHWYIAPLESTLMAPLVGFSNTVVDLLKKMAFGLIFALVFVGFMDLVPRQRFHSLVGGQKGVKGLARATMAGVLLDLCSHGILLVGMKLYERGLSLGQVMSFLIASPWNSFSMTLILWSLLGFRLTLAFIIISCVIAMVTGLIFEWLVDKGHLPENPNSQEPGGDKGEDLPWIVWPEEKGLALVKVFYKSSLSESKMILKWIFFGVILTGLVKEVIHPEIFKEYFGPDLVGVLLTLLSATVLEVCSEGSAPLASEFALTAHAPGNAFTFLMAGVATDYTEIMALKETTGSLKVGLFLPLVTVPQILVIGLIMNGVGGWN